MSALIPVLGIAGVLGLIALVTSDRIKRTLRSAPTAGDLALESHTIVCGWNANALELVTRLLHDDPATRKRDIAILTTDERPFSDETQAAFPGRVLPVRGDPTREDDLHRAGLRRAAHTVVLAPGGEPEPDVHTLMVVLAVQKAGLRLKRAGERDDFVSTTAELIDPANRRLFADAHVNQIICEHEFDERVLVQSCLNPGLTTFLNEVLSLGDDNEFYEVVVRGDEESPIAGATFNEALKVCRRAGVLLLGIHRAGTNGGGGLRPVIINPFRPEEKAYRIAIGDSLMLLADDVPALRTIFPQAGERVRETRL